MPLVATSAIQVWTLVIAALAVVASVTVGALTVSMTRRSEHTVWLRDLRVRLYSDCMMAANEYLKRVTVEEVSAPPQQEGSESAYSNRDEELDGLQYTLNNTLFQLNTFGALPVAMEATKMYFAYAALAAIPAKTPEERRELIYEAGHRNGELAVAMRKSLNISDD